MSDDDISFANCSYLPLKTHHKSFYALWVEVFFLIEFGVSDNNWYLIMQVKLNKLNNRLLMMVGYICVIRIFFLHMIAMFQYDHRQKLMIDLFQIQMTVRLLHRTFFYETFKKLKWNALLFLSIFSFTGWSCHLATNIVLITPPFFQHTNAFWSWWRINTSRHYRTLNCTR